MENEFGLRIRELRKKKGLTQQQLAGQVGLDFTYLSKIETGRVGPPSQEKIIALANALGCDPEELLLLAKRVPESLQSVIVSSGAIPNLLRTFRDGGISEAELEQLIAEIRKRREQQQ